MALCCMKGSTMQVYHTDFNPSCSFRSLGLTVLQGKDVPLLKRHPPAEHSKSMYPILMVNPEDHLS
eukprot:5074920-Amphidinium_carterae.1